MTNVDRDPSGELPIESNDDAVLRALGGAVFGPNARLTLPSGTVLSGPEAQAFTRAFAESAPADPSTPMVVELDSSTDVTDRNPLSSRNDTWTGDPVADSRSFVARALRAIRPHHRP